MARTRHARGPLSSVPRPRPLALIASAAATVAAAAGLLLGVPTQPLQVQAHTSVVSADQVRAALGNTTRALEPMTLHVCERSSPAACSSPAGHDVGVLVDAAPADEAVAWVGPGLDRGQALAPANDTRAATTASVRSALESGQRAGAAAAAARTAAESLRFGGWRSPWIWGSLALVGTAGTLGLGLRRRRLLREDAEVKHRYWEASRRIASVALDLDVLELAALRPTAAALPPSADLAAIWQRVGAEVDEVRRDALRLLSDDERLVDSWRRAPRRSPSEAVQRLSTDALELSTRAAGLMDIVPLLGAAPEDSGALRRQLDPLLHAPDRLLPLAQRGYPLSLRHGSLEATRRRLAQAVSGLLPLSAPSPAAGAKAPLPVLLGVLQAQDAILSEFMTQSLLPALRRAGEDVPGDAWALSQARHASWDASSGALRHLGDPSAPFLQVEGMLTWLEPLVESVAARWEDADDGLRLGSAPDAAEHDPWPTLAARGAHAGADAQLRHLHARALDAAAARPLSPRALRGLLVAALALAIGLPLGFVAQHPPALGGLSYAEAGPASGAAERSLGERAAAGVRTQRNGVLGVVVLPADVAPPAPPLTGGRLPRTDRDRLWAAGDASDRARALRAGIDAAPALRDASTGELRQDALLVVLRASDGDPEFLGLARGPAPVRSTDTAWWEDTERNESETPGEREASQLGYLGTGDLGRNPKAADRAHAALQGLATAWGRPAASLSPWTVPAGVAAGLVIGAAGLAAVSTVRHRTRRGHGAASPRATRRRLKALHSQLLALFAHEDDTSLNAVLIDAPSDPAWEERRLTARGAAYGLRRWEELASRPAELAASASHARDVERLEGLVASLRSREGGLHQRALQWGAGHEPDDAPAVGAGPHASG